jgi:hypothetical protein
VPVVRPIELYQMNLVMRQNPEMPFSGNIDLVTDLKNPNEQGAMFGTFVRFNKGRINNETRDGLLGMFVSSDLGGIGCTLRPGIRTEIMRKQAIVARDCRERIENGIKPKFSAKPVWKILSKVKNQLNGSIKNVIHGTHTDDPHLGFIASYKTSNLTRSLAKDDWTATMSKVRFNGRGYFVNKSKTQSFRNIVRERKHRYNDLNLDFDPFRYKKDWTQVKSPYKFVQNSRSSYYYPKDSFYTWPIDEEYLELGFKLEVPKIPSGGCINL